MSKQRKDKQSGKVEKSDIMVPFEQVCIRGIYRLFSAQIVHLKKSEINNLHLLG